MIGERTGIIPGSWVRGALLWIGYELLLVPEALLIAALLCLSWASGEPPLIGALAGLLIVSFIARMLALLGARMSLDGARHHEAEALAKIALALYPWSADTLALRGAIALANGNPAGALTALRRAIALLPDQPTFHAALSGALLGLDRSIEAAQAARRALALDPRCAVAHLYLAEADRTSGAPAQKVEDQLRAGLAVAGTPAAEAALRCALGEHLLAEHRLAEASLTLHGAEVLLPRCSTSHQVELRVRIGELLIAQGQIDRAREHFRNVAALDPHGRHTRAVWRVSQL
jgi:tetratricopeptide (TPR) repeat protein